MTLALIIVIVLALAIALYFEWGRERRGSTLRAEEMRRVTVHAHDDELADEASEESFPASDPPARW